MMHCEQFEALLADHLDGTLPHSQKAAFGDHLNSCRACSALEADARRALDFIALAEDVEPPPMLAAKILQSTNSGWEFKLRAKGIRGWINRTFAPVLQPRIVMGAMLTLMSLTMLTRCAGGPKAVTAADLDPVRLWSALDDRAHRVWDRTLKTYEGMRVVYEIRTQLNEWKQQRAEEEDAAADAKANSRKLQTPDLEVKSPGTQENRK